MRTRSCPATSLARALLVLVMVMAKDGVAADASMTEPPRTGLEKRKLSYWDQGNPRAFVSGRLELGLYVKQQIAVGYGQPNWFSVSAEAFGISTFSFGGGYAGIRGSLPFLDLRLGTRYTYSYDRSL